MEHDVAIRRRLLGIVLSRHRRTDHRLPGSLITREITQIIRRIEPIPAILDGTGHRNDPRTGRRLFQRRDGNRPWGWPVIIIGILRFRRPLMLPYADHVCQRNSKFFLKFVQVYIHRLAVYLNEARITQIENPARTGPHATRRIDMGTSARRKVDDAIVNCVRPPLQTPGKRGKFRHIRRF